MISLNLLLTSSSSGLIWLRVVLDASLRPLAILKQNGLVAVTASANRLIRRDSRYREGGN